VAPRIRFPGWTWSTTGASSSRTRERLGSTRTELQLGARGSGNLQGCQAPPSILAEQLAYYLAVANEYEYHGIDGVAGLDDLLAAVAAFRPTGDVVELACGTGIWTQQLVRSATTVTAVDAAPEMLARARARTDLASVCFVEADLFSWHPHRRYDTVFFGFWLSHVPEEHFDSFWSLVDDCLRPGGDAFFFDDNYRTEAEMIQGTGSPVVERRRNDGTPFRIIKVPFQAEGLERRLCVIGWNIVVTPLPVPSTWAGVVELCPRPQA
jgi:SAM-dependent methyltransferase